METKSKHTPEPWELTPLEMVDGILMRAVTHHSEKKSRLVANVYMAGDDGEPNARLIKAAPTLLAIARRIAELMESGDMPGKDWTEGAQLAAAIAAAEAGS